MPPARALTSAPVRALDPPHRLGGEGLGEGDVVAAAGVEVRVVATPGHTADSLWFLLGDAVLTGDTVRRPRHHGCRAPGRRLADYLDSLRRLQELGTCACCRGTARSCPTSPRHQRTSPTASSASTRSGRPSPLGPDAAAMQVVRVVYADVDQGAVAGGELSVPRAARVSAQVIE